MIFRSQNDWPWVTAITVTGKGGFDFALFEGLFGRAVISLAESTFLLEKQYNSEVCVKVNCDSLDIPDRWYNGLSSDQ